MAKTELIESISTEPPDIDIGELVVARAKINEKFNEAGPKARKYVDQVIEAFDRALESYSHWGPLQAKITNLPTIGWPSALINHLDISEKTSVDVTLMRVSTHMVSIRIENPKTNKWMDTRIDWNRNSFDYKTFTNANHNSEVSQVVSGLNENLYSSACVTAFTLKSIIEPLVEMVMRKKLETAKPEDSTKLFLK